MSSYHFCKAIIKVKHLLDWKRD